MSDDVVAASPSMAKVIFENDRVSVIQLKFKGRQKMPMHSHPANLVYAVTSSKMKSTSPKGKSQKLSMKAGSVGWSDGGSHEVENLDRKTAVNIIFELK